MLKSGISDGFHLDNEKNGDDLKIIREMCHWKKVPTVNTRRSPFNAAPGNSLGLSNNKIGRALSLSRRPLLAIGYRARFTPSERVERSASAKSRLIGLMSRAFTRASCSSPAATCIRRPDTGCSEDSVATGFIALRKLHKIHHTRCRITVMNTVAELTSKVYGFRPRKNL